SEGSWLPIQTTSTQTCDSLKFCFGDANMHTRGRFMNEPCDCVHAQPRLLTVLHNYDLAAEQPENARRRLEEIVSRWLQYADAHRALAVADEELGFKSQAVRERSLAARPERRLRQWRPVHGFAGPGF